MELLEAIRKLKQRNEKTKAAFQVLIVGKPWNAEYYRQLLHNKNKGLQEVTFVGFVENLPAFLRDADLFVCPSLADTNPTVNLQAMASGLPIIASSVGAIPETVIDGQTGFLVRPGDSSELAEKLSLMVDDYKLRREMGREGRVRAERLFSIDRIAGLMFNTYKELLARNANQRKN
jgi:glycosyltransferase involved in cell wall biosynthesis